LNNYVFQRKKVNPADLFAASPHGQRIVEDLKSNVLTQPQGHSRHYDVYGANVFRQVFEISKRFVMNGVRDKSNTGSRFGVLIAISLLMGTLYYQSSLNQKGAQNRVSLMFFIGHVPDDVCNV
jgi:hypothetical protein